MATLTEVRDRGRRLFTGLLVDQEPSRAPAARHDSSLFSWFDEQQALDASLLALRICAAAASREDEAAGLAAALDIVEEESAAAGPELVRQGFALFVTHNNRGRRLVKPRVVAAAPGLFLAPEVKRIGGALSIGGLSPTLDYWREDMLANEHHQHWHEVYPFVGRPPEDIRQWVREASVADQAALLEAIAPQRDWAAELAGASPAQVANLFAQVLNGPGRSALINAAFGDPPRVSRRVFRQLFRLNDRHGELFLYMHRQMLARYDAELLSHQLDPVAPFANDQWAQQIPEGYDPEGLDDGESPFTKRLQNRTLPSPFVARLQRLSSAIKEVLDTGVIPRPLATDPDQPITASALGEFIETGLHNVGHGMLGALSEPIAPGQDPNGVMNNPLGAIRDQVFWRWHKHIDNLSDRWEITRNEEDFSDGPRVLLRDGLAAGGPSWASPDIILVRKSDLPNQSESQLAQLGERLFGGAEWDSDFTAAVAESGNVSLTTLDELVTVISTARLASGRTIKYLNHEPFSYFIRAENTSDEALGVTVRIFLVPRATQQERRAWIELDKFSATLAAGQKVVLHRPDTESAVIKRPAEDSPTAIEDRPTGPDAYCDCGWPYTLLLPRGTPEGTPYRLLVMLTDAAIDNVVEPGHCGSMSFCGARDRYPDNREMGYPFARPFGAPGIPDALLALPNAAGRSVRIRHSGA